MTATAMRLCRGLGLATHEGEDLGFAAAAPRASDAVRRRSESIDPRLDYPSRSLPPGIFR